MSDRPGHQEKIIDAEAEPIGKGAAPRRGLRLTLYLLGAIVLSIVIAVGYQLGSTGRLGELFAGGSSAPSPSTAPKPIAPPSPPSAPAAVLPATPAPPLPDAALLQRLDEQEKRLAALTASLERLQQLPAANAGDPQKLADLEQQLAALRASGESSAAQRAALQQQVAELQGRLTALGEARLAALREPLVQLIAFAELREKARRGDSFAREATALGQYAENQGGSLKTAFAALQPLAEQDVPAETALAARFATLAEQQRSTAPDEPAAGETEKPWWQRAVDKLTGLISVRRIGSLDRASLDGRLDAAETALRDGDLAVALGALEGVTLIAPLAEWREQATARLQLNAALDSYGAALRGHLAVR